MKIIKFITLAIILVVSSIRMMAQLGCTPEVIREAERKVHDYVRNYPISIDDTQVDYNGTVCVNIGEIPLQDFVILSEYVEYNPTLMSQLSKGTEYGIIRMFNKEKGVYCEHVFYRHFGKSNTRVVKPANLAEAERRLKKAENTLAARKAAYDALVKNQKELFVDDVNLLGEILVAEIPSTKRKQIDEQISKAAQELKQKGIDKLSKAMDVNYVPSTNKTADFIESIVKPIDKVLNVSGVDLGKYSIYWEIIKRTPKAGMTIGNLAAQCEIYFRQSELKKEIADLEKQVALERDNVNIIKNEIEVEEHRNLLYPH